MKSRITYVKNCPECEGETQVIDSREEKDGSIHRRRICVMCGHRFNTAELELCMIGPTDPLIEIEALKAELERLKKIINVAKDVLKV